MANEFQHKDPGTELTQTEFIAACGDGHIFACQDTGDILYASSATVLKNLEKGVAGTILNMGGSCIPAWNASPSFTALTLSGALDVNGSIDFDGTTAAFDGSGAITLTSTSTSANGIYLRANGGTSETVKIHSDLGTSVTEGAASVSLISDAGGVELRSTANLANAINLTVDSGTTSSIAIFNDTGNATGSICLKSDVGGITLNPATFVTVGGNATNAGEVRILEDTDNGSNYVALKAPNVATSYTITLPTAVAGTCGFVLTSTTAGVTSWASAGGGLDSSADAIINNGYGIILGNCAQLVAGDNPGCVVAEFQMAGTANADTSLHLIRHSADAVGPQIRLAKSRHATIGSHTIVQVCDVVGTIGWYADDGVDLVSPVAEIRAVIDTYSNVGTSAAAPGANDMPGRLEFYTTPDGTQASVLAMTINNGGIITTPLQPAFRNAGDGATNVTGDNLLYTVIFATANYDQNSDFDDTSTFTAPVTGLYHFDTTIEVTGLTTSHTRSTLQFAASNRIDNMETGSLAAIKSANDQHTMMSGTDMDMDAGDTMVIKINIQNGARVVDISSGEVTKFNGRLAV